MVQVIWAIPYALAGLYDFLQGQGYLPQSWLRLSEIIPIWCYWVWLGIGILLFAGLTYEGAYRIARRKIGKELMVARIRTRIEAIEQSLESQINLPSNKVSFVVQKIAEAKRITPKGSDVIVYLSEFANVVNVEEINSILLKLQNDEKVLTITYFPNHLLPYAQITKDWIAETMLNALDSNREQFRVKIRNTFDNSAKRLGMT
jgi:hypothetical protein